MFLYLAKTDKINRYTFSLKFLSEFIPGGFYLDIISTRQSFKCSTCAICYNFGLSETVTVGVMFLSIL